MRMLSSRPAGTGGSVRSISWTVTGPLDDSIPQFPRSQSSCFEVPASPPSPQPSSSHVHIPVSVLPASRSTMVDWSDIWNITSGVLSLAPCFFGYLYHQLPSYLFRLLDGTLKETESLLGSSMEDGLITDSSLTLKYMQSAEQLRTRAERMRPLVYRATTYWLELRSIFDGLSREISKLSAEVLGLRAEVCAAISSSRERLRDEAELAPSEGGAGTVADAHVGL
ncbi:hypothetical protein GSI_04364 [Ganoderma sinense ZZ0214-1]|uniref:Uncharacterized protein n=1 Tax=Ganoderma sinense ZZ0214-1 TaxID=1077348 RepID=A0A2G8SIZ9_9APHY|nr:hypothetical protein GSI_04364 [Ganoderma sinense ZZ0214-1]